MRLTVMVEAERDARERAARRQEQQQERAHRMIDSLIRQNECREGGTRIKWGRNVQGARSAVEAGRGARGRRHFGNGVSVVQEASVQRYLEGVAR